MKTRRAARALSVLLIIALLCGVFPAAYAETETPAAAAEPTASRQETMLSFLRLVMQAEAAHDPDERAALCREAEALWNEYLETAPVGNTMLADALEGDEDKLERQDMLFDLVQYIMAAETESDPVTRASYYLQADAIWYSYLGLVNSAATPEPAKDPLREQALEEFLRSMADPDMDPAEQERFLTEAQKLWDTYYDMVLQAMEASKPAEAEPQEAPAPEEKPALEETPAPQPEEPEDDAANEPHVETYTFYANSWDELEDMFQDILNGVMTVDPENAPSVGLPNPWIESRWLEEAQMIAGLSYSLPEKALPEGMKLTGYRAMKGTIEADYSDGENELMVRASTGDEGFTLSGDYNSYSKEWTESFGELTVDCLGDGKTVNVASYKIGDVAVALTMACGLEGQGLTVGELKAIVTDLKAETARNANPMEAYADPWAYWDAWDFGPFTSSFGGHSQASGEQTEDNTQTPKTGTETKGSEPKTGTETRPGSNHRERDGKSYGPGYYYYYFG